MDAGEVVVVGVVVILCVGVVVDMTCDLGEVACVLVCDVLSRFSLCVLRTRTISSSPTCKN